MTERYFHQSKYYGITKIIEPKATKIPSTAPTARIYGQYQGYSDSKE